MSTMTSRTWHRCFWESWVSLKGWEDGSSPPRVP
ncbi:hypothetical protein LEMLEM_LOCUS9211 [Lemmus lemmus]